MFLFYLKELSLQISKRKGKNASHLVPQTEVEAVQFDVGGGPDGGLLFEVLLPALQ